MRMSAFLCLYDIVGHIEHSVLVHSAAGHDIREHQVVVERLLDRFFLV
jgi:hypothetical protein